MLSIVEISDTEAKAVLADERKGFAEIDASHSQPHAEDVQHENLTSNQVQETARD